MHEIYVLSTNAHKVNTIKNIFPHTNVNEISVNKITTGFKLPLLPPQPINDGGLKCALRRIEYFKKYAELNLIDITNSLIISIENFIDTAKCCDYCCIVIEFKGKNMIGNSYELQILFPSNILSELGKISKFAEDIDGYPLTVGTYLHSIEHDVPADNWISTLYPEIDRTDQIISAYDNLNVVSFLHEFIVEIPDFPKPGVSFKNILPLLANPFLLHFLTEELLKIIKNIIKPDYIVALEARGFLLAPLIASRLNCGIITVRKPGKLPGKVYSYSYEKEYGHDTFEIPTDCIPEQTNILVIDDVLAFGGALYSTRMLLENFKPNTIKYLVLCQVKQYTDMVKEKMGEKYKDIFVLFE